jgi:hypothetical protein
MCGTVHENLAFNLVCPSPTEKIATVSFAGFGHPSGTCTHSSNRSSSANSFADVASCNTGGVAAMVAKECVGKQSCSLAPTCKEHTCTLFPGSGHVRFQDPCRFSKKWVDVAITCSTSISSARTAHTTSTGNATFAAATADAKKGGGGGNGNVGDSGGGGGVWAASAGPYVADDPWTGATVNWTVVVANTAANWSSPGFNPLAPHGSHPTAQPWTLAGVAEPASTMQRRSVGSLVTQDIERIPATSATLVEAGCWSSFQPILWAWLQCSRRMCV